MTLAHEPIASEGCTDLVMRRLFEAPIATVFRAWVDPEQFAAWFGPHGSRMTVFLQDVRPGGHLHFCHHLGDHPEVWVRGIYHEVAVPTLLSFSVGFADPEHDVAFGFVTNTLGPYVLMDPRAQKLVRVLASCL